MDTNTQKMFAAVGGEDTRYFEEAKRAWMQANGREPYSSADFKGVTEKAVKIRQKALRMKAGRGNGKIRG